MPTAYVPLVEHCLTYIVMQLAIFPLQFESYEHSRPVYNIGRGVTMDPASALGVASAVIAFIEFSTELISGACEIYKSLDGKTDENAHIELIVEDLSRASRSLSIPSSTVDGARTAYEKDIIALSTKCQKKCDALYTIFTQLRPKSKSTWSSFRSAWMSRRKQGDIAGIYSELRDYRSAMLLRMSQRHM